MYSVWHSGILSWCSSTLCPVFPEKILHDQLDRGLEYGWISFPHWGITRKCWLLLALFWPPSHFLSAFEVTLCCCKLTLNEHLCPLAAWPSNPLYARLPVQVIYLCSGYVISSEPSANVSSMVTDTWTCEWVSRSWLCWTCMSGNESWSGSLPIGGLGKEEGSWMSETGKGDTDAVVQ